MYPSADYLTNISHVENEEYLSVKDRVMLLNQGIKKCKADDVKCKKVDKCITDEQKLFKKWKRLHLHERKIVAPNFEDNRDTSNRPISIFVGTWNCVYQEFMESTALLPSSKHATHKSKSHKESITHWFAHLFDGKEDKMKRRRLRKSVSSSVKESDEKIIKLKEPDSENIHDSIEIKGYISEIDDVQMQYTELQSTNTLELPSLYVVPTTGNKIDNCSSGKNIETSPITNLVPTNAPKLQRASTLQLKPLGLDDDEPLNDWIDSGYDIYVIALQETVSSNLFNIISKYLARESDNSFTRIELEHYKLSGYGDGALLHTKSTTLAVWVRTELLYDGSVMIGKSKAFALSLLNHSKGVITLQMKILDQIVCIIGGHLPAKFDERQKAASTILKKVAESYGGCHGVQFQDVFHHVLWTGDFNFRVRNISAQEAIILLNDNKRDLLFYNDELYSGKASIFIEYGFEEGVIKFDPTYKKRDDRDVMDKSLNNWADKEYQTHFGIKWYKGGNVCERVPSWTDRVLKWSMPSLKTCLEIDDKSYKAALPNCKNMLLASDHSPVSCGLLLWPLLKTYVPPQRMNIDRF